MGMEHDVVNSVIARLQVLMNGLSLLDDDITYHLIPPTNDDDPIQLKGWLGVMKNGRFIMSMTLREDEIDVVMVQKKDRTAKMIVTQAAEYYPPGWKESNGRSRWMTAKVYYV